MITTTELLDKLTQYGQVHTKLNDAKLYEAHEVIGFKLSLCYVKGGLVCRLAIADDIARIGSDVAAYVEPDIPEDIWAEFAEFIGRQEPEIHNLELLDYVEAKQRLAAGARLGTYIVLDRGIAREVDVQGNLKRLGEMMRDAAMVFSEANV